MGWLPYWKKRIPITIDPTTISGGLSSDLTDFPVLIKLSDSSGRNNKDISSVFNELNSYEDDFAGTNGDAPREDYWTTAGNADSWSVQIYNNKVRCSWTESTGSTYRTAYIHTNNKITPEGDFSVFIKFTRVSTTFNTGEIRMYANFPNSGAANQAYVYVWWNTGGGTQGIRGRIYEEGILVADVNVNKGTWAEVNNSYFRIRRAGMGVYCDYDNGGGWTNLTSFVSQKFLGKAYFICPNYSSTDWNGTQVVDWDDFSCTTYEIFDTNERDFAVTAADGLTQCYCIIDEWATSSGYADIHAKIPTISHITNTQLYLYYNNDKFANAYYVGENSDTQAFLCIGTDRQGAYDGRSLLCPCVIKDGSLYKMWYSAQDWSDSTWRIMYAESKDLYKWTNHQLAIDINTELVFDTTHVFCPRIIKDDGIYKMWYGGHNGANWRTLYADSIDGLTWENHQMVMDIGDYTPFDDTDTIGAAVIKDGPIYKAWYCGYNSVAPNNYWKIIYAVSLDGIIWANHQVVIDKLDGGPYTASNVHYPCVIKENDSYKIWYSGSDGNYRIMHAKSNDGINWSNHELVIDLGTEGHWDNTHAYIPGVIADNETTVSGAYHVFYTGYPSGAESCYRILHARSYGSESNIVTVSGFMTTTGSGVEWDNTIAQSDNDDLLTYGDLQYYVGARQRADVLYTQEDRITIRGEVPEERYKGYITVYDGTSDGGTNPSNWDSYEEFGLKEPEDTFDTTISGLTRWTTHYYRWYATYSGSEPSEDWSPSYSFYLYKGHVLKGSSDNYIAVFAEPESTFYNTRFAAVSYGVGGGLNVVNDDVPKLFFPSTVSGIGNTIKEDPSDMVSVR